MYNNNITTYISCIKYTIYMYIYDEYNKYKNIFRNLNTFVYKTDIDYYIKYYNENIKNNDNYNSLVNYDYYKEFEIKAEDDKNEINRKDSLLRWF